MRYAAGMLISVCMLGHCAGEMPRAFPEGGPSDIRTGELRNLNGYFPFQRVETTRQWDDRQAEIRRRILVSQGLWPLPTKTPMRAVIHGRVERDDYVVDRVYLESAPGHFLTGSLYRPVDQKGPMPAILSPHGHWNQGRFYDAGEKQVSGDLESGAEQFKIGGRYPIQARAVQLARMGCLVFVYDMTGNADSIQIEHRPSKWSHLDKADDWGFMSVQADLRQQNMMGLQTWNSIRAIDFLLELKETDPSRIGVTGASGGGTQSMIISAIDDRIAAAMPCVMVSTAMQGGCTCENAPLLRIDQGNIDIAAATAPRPLGLTAADDWTIELETKGYPDLVGLYEMLGHTDRLTAVFHTQFKHNYNQVNRAAMYSFFNRHFQLGFETPIKERDLVPLTREEATVWTDEHPRPSGDQVGDAHEVKLLQMATADSDKQMTSLVPSTADDLRRYKNIVGGAWETILGRRLDQVGDVTFTQTDSVAVDDVDVHIGFLDHVDRGEQLPAYRIAAPRKKQRGKVIWIGDSGKSSVMDADHLITPVRDLVEDGFEVITADLFGQGEFTDDGQPVAAQRMWYQRDGTEGWQRFSGYTYGFNNCLFAKRVHDILSLIRYAHSTSDGDVHLVGLGSTAGPLVAAARSQSGDAIGKTILDVERFQFIDLEKHDDPMFVPAAVKYLDVDGLLSLCAPAELVVIDNAGKSGVVRETYDAAGASDRLVYIDRNRRGEIASLIRDNE